jgi:acyl-CoA dehydrogenase
MPRPTSPAGRRADVLVCAVATKPESGHRGISFLLIDRGEGIRRTALGKLGWHASDTAEIGLDDVFVPGENLLGTLHGGFYEIMANFQWERPLMALGAVGAMQACSTFRRSWSAPCATPGRARSAAVPTRS